MKSFFTISVKGKTNRKENIKETSIHFTYYIVVICSGFGLGSSLIYPQKRCFDWEKVIKKKKKMVSV